MSPEEIYGQGAAPNGAPLTGLQAAQITAALARHFLQNSQLRFDPRTLLPPSIPVMEEKKEEAPISVTDVKEEEAPISVTDDEEEEAVELPKKPEAVANNPSPQLNSDLEDINFATAVSTLQSQRFGEILNRRVQGQKRSQKTRGRQPHTRCVNSEEDPLYRMKRIKNNESAKKSRNARRQRQELMLREAERLEKENADLRAQVVELRQTSATLRLLIAQRCNGKDVFDAVTAGQ